MNVMYYDIHEHIADWAKWLRKKVDGMHYPPKMVLDIYYLKEQTKVEGHGFTLQVTGLRGDHYRNMSLEFYVLSVIYQEKACVNHSFLANLTIQNTIKQKKKAVSQFRLFIQYI